MRASQEVAEERQLRFIAEDGTRALEHALRTSHEELHKERAARSQLERKVLENLSAEAQLLAALEDEQRARESAETSLLRLERLVAETGFHLEQLQHSCQQQLVQVQ
eukprot:SM000197S05457  [mRNA]  locus=s197:98261:99361:+ [translate_table: standard]